MPMMDTLDQREERKVRTVFMLDKSEREELKKLSADTGAPVAELLRRSVEAWLKRQAPGA